MLAGLPYKFIFFAPADIQIARVDKQCIVYACEALQRLGIDVELVAIKIKLLKGELQSDDPLRLYRCRTPPRVRLVPSLASQTSSGAWSALNRLLAHALTSVRALVRSSKGDDLVFYTKNYASAAVFLALRACSNRNVKVVFEAHTVPHNFFQGLTLKRLDGVIANSLALEQDLKASVSTIPMIGLHQGVDLEHYNTLRISQAEARQRVGFSENQKHIVYTGKVYWGYGEVEHLLATARTLDPRIQLTLVGGRKDHVEKYQRLVAERSLNNVKVVGFVPPAEVQWYQLAADILVSYYPSGIELNRYRSPGKLFEYMAAGRAVVTADYPSLREVLDESMAVFVPPDNPVELGRQLNLLAFDEPKLKELGANALARASEYTWDVRAQRIHDFLGSLAGMKRASTGRGIAQERGAQEAAAGT